MLRSLNLIPQCKTVWEKLVWQTGIALLAAALLTSCTKDPGDQEPIVSVQAAIAERATLKQTITTQGVLFPLQQAAIAPKINAPVKKFLVNRGGKVHKGQLLAVLENRDLMASSEENKGGLEQAQAAYATTTAASLPEELQKAQLDTEAAKRLLDAQEKVYQSRQELFQQGALPRKELDQAGVDVTQARNQYEIAQKHYEALEAVGKQQELKSAAGQLQAAQGKYMGAAAQLSYSEIRSPIDGFVADRPLYPGEMTNVGAPLITVMDISHVIAKAHIPQTEAAQLAVGDKATLLVPGESDPVDGRLTVVSPALDSNSTTVEVWVQAANPKQRLRPGTSVRISILAKTVENAVSIPSASVITDPSGATAAMLIGMDNRAHQTVVKLGIQEGDRVQILEGVQPGDKVIVAGAYALPDKTRVSIEAAKEPSGKKPDAGAKDSNEKGDEKD